MRLLGWFVPEELWPWVGVGLLVGWLVGLISLRTVFAFGWRRREGPLVAHLSSTLCRNGRRPYGLR